MVHTVEPTPKSVRSFALAVEEAGPSSVTDEALVAHVNYEKCVEEKAKEERQKWIRWWTQSSTTVWNSEYTSPNLLNISSQNALQNCRANKDQ